MKKIVLMSIIILFFVINQGQNADANAFRWVKCGTDINCVRQASGFTFSLNVPNYKMRAKNNLIEIKYPYDKNRDVYVRKSPVALNNGDISGVNDNFPVSKQIKLKNGVKVNVRGYSNEFFVATFPISKNYYSIYCRNGLKKKDINEIYEKIQASDK